MIYLVSQDWSNTSNNHAGIKHLCNKLQDLYPDLYRSLVIPCYMDDRILSKNIFFKKLQVRYARYQTKVFIKSIIDYFCITLKSNDIVFFMEYFERLSPMNILAETIHSSFPNVKLWGMVHLIPHKLSVAYPNDSELNDCQKNISKIFTLGHSLSDYLIQRGVRRDKIVTTFHYVDNYYMVSQIRQHPKVKVIAMGNQVRNLKLLRAIVAANPCVDFTICQGVIDMSDEFVGLNNVSLIPFVLEPDLRQYMLESDISLNAMQDTIGSNVIVSSLAMGLAMICSDVGSIRDYCDDSNTIFCDNNDVESFSKAIRMLSTNMDLLKKMKEAARMKSRCFSIENFSKEIEKKV